MKTQDQKRFPALARANQAASRRLARAARAIWAAREALLIVGNEPGFTRQEQDAAQAMVEDLVRLNSAVNQQVHRDLTANAAFWTDRDEAAEAQGKR